MAKTDLTFTKIGNKDFYQSSVVEPKGNTVVEITFDKVPNDIVFEQSLSGDNFETFSVVYNYYDTTFCRNINGFLEGEYLRIKTTNQPTSCKYIQN